MLKELYIENLAVIEKASIEFTDGMNVFTGETGAGKSILINGINAVLGQRTTKDIVRNGCKKALVSAVFDDIPVQTLKLLSDNGVECENSQLIISREISSDGGSVARINSRPANVSLLKEIGEQLVNIHGQHDNQVLLSPDKHLGILDSYGELEPLLSDYRADFRKLQELSRKIKQLSVDDAAKSSRIEYLSQVINDIKPMELLPDEDDIIERKFLFAENSLALSASLALATRALYGDDEAGGASMLVTNAASQLSEYKEEFSDLEPIVDRINSVKIELDDIAGELIRLSGSLEINPQSYAKLSSRRDDIINMKRKYNTDVNGLIKLCEESGDELLSLTSSESSIEQLSNERQELLKKVSQKAYALSDARKQTAECFCKEVAGELSFLSMPNVSIDVAQEKGKLTVNGLDNVELLICANLGEAPKPIAKIASGGELSRIMLALKNVIAHRDNIPTLIFDEIDTGVSGVAAQKIGVKLKQISKLRQVLCVTHLSQLAVFADNHLLIEKTVREGRTVTQVCPLDNDGRVAEVARILGGENISETTLKNAAELIQKARED